MANLSNINGKFVVEQTTGYVGVGTTDPNYPIEVLNASAEIALNASGGSTYRLQSDSASNFIIRKEGVGDRLVINSAGNSTFAGTIQTTGANLFYLGKGVYTKATNASNDVDATNIWGYGLYEGAAILGELSTIRDGTVTLNLGTTYTTGKVVIRTDNKVTALTIDSSQNSTFAGNGIFTGSVTSSYLAVNGSAIVAEFNGTGSSYVQGAIALRSSNADTPEARGQGVFMYNQGTDTTWYTGTTYSNADRFIIGRATNASLNTEAARINNSFLTVLNSGNVGIGTTAPSATEPIGGNLPTGWTRTGSKALEIAAPDFANSGLFLRNSGTTATGTDITGDQYFGDTYIDNRFNSDNGSIYFRTKTAVSPQIRMAIKGSGNVGIGTDSPRDKLTVKTPGSASVETGLRLVNPFGFGSALAGARIIFAQDRSDSENYEMAAIQSTQSYGGSSAGGGLAFYTRNTTLQKAMHIKNTGTVEIPLSTAGSFVQMGTTSTAGMLNVGGKIFAAQNISSSAAMNITRTLIVPHGGATTFTYDFNPNSIWGFSYTGGHVEINVAGWSQRLNAGYIQFQNAGSGGPITTCQFVQSAVVGNGTISVAPVNPGVTNVIRITFTNWHNNAHAWNCWISSPKT